jgi:heterodisulfide reductase subunit B
MAKDRFFTVKTFTGEKKLINEDDVIKKITQSFKWICKEEYINIETSSLVIQYALEELNKENIKEKKEEISDGLMVLQESIDKLYRLHNGKEKFFIGHYED